MSQKTKVIITLVIITLAAFFLFRSQINRLFFKPTTSTAQPGVTTSNLSTSLPKASPIEPITIVAQNLDIPWEVAFLPTVTDGGTDGDLLVTERPGRLLKVTQGKQQLIQEIQGVNHIGEGGLMGLALHPEFGSNRWLYLYLTSSGSQGVINRLERYQLGGNTLSDRQVLLDNITGSSVHDGGRIAFGPDGYLYIGTGDAGNEQSAQDTNSLNGKILRVNDDGSIPPDNPFGNEVYSYGHRNVQGIAWDDSGNLWATEHGPSGNQTGYDELNLIRKGGNYGWPVIRGDQTRDGMVTPVLQSGSTDTWAPAGLAYLDGSLYFAGLRGASLYQTKLSGTSVSSFIAHFTSDYGRLRAVTLSPNNLLYISTSNTDGRGSVNQGDDKIILIKPEIFD